ncbi:MAG: efflux RND transporter periplasmic adaptor subunit [bacterium]|nr:efflux RND transporter periplasmic adaptor subunit [bacterium]
MKRITSIITVLIMIMALCACGSGNTKAGDGDAANPEAAAGKTPDATSKDARAGVMIKVKPLTYEKFEHYFHARGTVEAVEDAFISPEINGRIKKIHVKEGQRVRKGQLLISLNSEVTESSIAEIQSGLELARTVYKKRKGLWEKKIGSEIQYLQAKTDNESLENKLKTMQAQLKMARIKAPIDGIVDDVSIKEGEMAAPGIQVIRLVNLKKVYINADVSESYLPKVGQGDTVEVSFPTYPELTMDAVIHRIGNVVKKANRTFLVQLLLDNPEEKLKPNLLAMIRMKDFHSEAALVVPAIIIKNDLTGSYLYVVDKDKESGKDVARKAYVTPGISQGSKTMVDKGLETGQQVIVDGYNLVKNGMTVQIATGEK